MFPDKTSMNSTNRKIGYRTYLHRWARGHWEVVVPYSTRRRWAREDQSCFTGKVHVDLSKQLIKRFFIVV